MWYGKGPGVDRTGDVFRHANFAGTSKHGGVLALMGDDHTAESSTTAHQSEYHFIDVMIPILNPAGVQEVLDYGLYGWAMSRFTGAWVALKTMHETIESTAAIDASLDRINIVLPTDFRCRKAGSISAPIHPGAGSAAARLSSATPCSPSCAPTSSTAPSPRAAANPKIGIITTGKSYLDVRQALDELGIDEVGATSLAFASTSRLRLAAQPPASLSNSPPGSISSSSSRRSAR
jgi:indolepyruvate ferredoxin oxidoreductase